MSAHMPDLQINTLTHVYFLFPFTSKKKQQQQQQQQESRDATYEFKDGSMGGAQWHQLQRLQVASVTVSHNPEPDM
jgi:hypothetical protein